MGPNPVASVLVKKREIWTQINRVESLPRKMEVENGIILPEANHHHKFLANTKTWKRKNFNLESLEAAWLWWHLDFRLFWNLSDSFRTVKEYISVILITHPVCGTSSWWLRETNSIRDQALNEIHRTHKCSVWQPFGPDLYPWGDRRQDAGSISPMASGRRWGMRVNDSSVHTEGSGYSCHFWKYLLGNIMGLSP